jgi:hypothetical protein
MLVGIYSTKRNIMELISSFHIDKEWEGRKKKKRVTKVEVVGENREEQQRRNKSNHSRKDKRVTFEDMETPDEDVAEINVNEVTYVP